MNLRADRSVHLVVTSPPYWQLKDYGTEKQIGFHESYESYINNLNLVWNECERVLIGKPVHWFSIRFLSGCSCKRGGERRLRSCCCYKR
jgi:DNA modification methylase